MKKIKQNKCVAQSLIHQSVVSGECTRAAGRSEDREKNAAGTLGSQAHFPARQPGLIPLAEHLQQSEVSQAAWGLTLPGRADVAKVS